MTSTTWHVKAQWLLCVVFSPRNMILAINREYFPRQRFLGFLCVETVCLLRVCNSVFKYYLDKLQAWGWGGESPVFHRGGPGSTMGQSVRCTVILQFSHVSIIPPVLHTLISAVLVRRKSRITWKPSDKAVLFRMVGAPNRRDFFCFVPQHNWQQQMSNYFAVLITMAFRTRALAILMLEIPPSLLPSSCV